MEPQVEAIKSGEYGGRWGLIIDSAMNAPMLMEAGAMTGGTAGRRLADRGLRHMLTLAAGTSCGRTDPPLTDWSSTPAQGR